MNTFKILLLVFLVFAITFILTEPPHFSELPDLRQDNLSKNILEYFSYDIGNINVVFFSKASLMYTPKSPETIAKQVMNSSFLAGINAGYFLSDFSHAGLLIQDGEMIVDIALNDSQLTHIVQIGEFIEFFPKEKFFELPKDKEFTYFQTGPLIIDRNQIQTIAISNSVNANRKTFRSFLGYTSTGRNFVVQTLLPFDLFEIAKLLLSLDVFRNSEISVVNLDGGSSVSFFSKERNDFNFNIRKSLPSILLIK